jgi:hypothetical protein
MHHRGVSAESEPGEELPRREDSLKNGASLQDPHRRRAGEEKTFRQTGTSVTWNILLCCFERPQRRRTPRENFNQVLLGGFALSGKDSAQIIRISPGKMCSCSAAQFKDWNQNMRKLDQIVDQLQDLGLRAATLLLKP